MHRGSSVWPNKHGKHAATACVRPGCRLRPSVVSRCQPQDRHPSSGSEPVQLPHHSPSGPLSWANMLGGACVASLASLALLMPASSAISSSYSSSALTGAIDNSDKSTQLVTTTGLPMSLDPGSIHASITGRFGSTTDSLDAQDTGSHNYSLSPEYALASQTEDVLLEAVRQFDARLDSAVGALSSTLPSLKPTTQSYAQKVEELSNVLIGEVWQVVDSYYLDARGTGWDREKWASLRDEALATRHRDVAAIYRSIRDMMARGLSDPYCRFIPKKELAAMSKYDVTGVGLNLGTADEYVHKTNNPLPPAASSSGDPSKGVWVVGVSRGSPADTAGIVQGDRLLAVAAHTITDDTSVFEASTLVQTGGDAPRASGRSSSGSSSGDGKLIFSLGPAALTGSNDSSSSSPSTSSSGLRDGFMTLQVLKPDGSVLDARMPRPMRSAVPSPVSVSLQPAVSGSGRSSSDASNGGTLSGPTGIIRLTSFNARAQRDVSEAVRSLEAKGVTRLVLDLRDNRGGLVSEGLEVASLFLDGGAPIVITEGRGAVTESTPRAEGPPLTKTPLLVLVNEHTASASEIVAGALRDNCRAVLAGGRTYGKGLIQSVYELEDGSGLVLTVGKYLTPARTDIDRFGIRPDFATPPSAADFQNTLEACRLTARR